MSWLAMKPDGTGAWSPGSWLSGGLDRSTLVVAGVATLGLIMAVLDTTIVNVVVIELGPILAGLALVGLFIWHSLHIERPLIDLRLFRSTGFSAAASTTFFLGAALFGTLLILPLYYQVDRGESALNAGLLLAPQGIGTGRRLGWRNQWRQSRVKLKEDPCRPCLDLN